ncbi:hypothetical protein ESCO_003887 [Escovopsis weberi]|uniref:Uncharacterized protein n=1 Tax=Escovopsis weberi TaxID=150374 RepID=A0A0M8N085_ESCWE|nr:hypothetical protein ESCO_003887 [Escovopsis weberi]
MNQPSARPSHPIVRSPATPSELLTHILAHLRHPTTILICWPKSVFLAALVQDPKPNGPQHQGHILLHDSLLQRAISRHLRLAFIPSVAHLRAYLTTFSTTDPGSKTSPPPPPPTTTTSRSSSRGSSPHRPALLVYGLLELHRDGSEWSAQGLGVSGAALVEAAARSSLRPVVVEPRGAMGYDALDEFLDQEMPILSGDVSDADGPAFRRRSVPVRRVLGRWFEFEESMAEADQDGGEMTRESGPEG